MSNEIRFKIGVDGARETQQVLQGLRKETVETAKAADAARNRAGAPAASGPSNPASAEAAAATARKRVVAQYEAWRRGEETRTARERDAHLRAGVQAEQRAGQSRLQAIQSFAARAIAAYQTVSQRASALSGAFGGRSREAMLGENMNLQMQMIRFSRDTGIDRRSAQRSVLGAARASGLDPSAVLAGLSTGADIAGDAGGAAITRHASDIARTASALGTDVGTLATPLGQALNRGMDEAAIPRFLNRFAAVATASRIAPEDLSGRLGGAIAQMSTLTGASGEESVLRTMQLQGVVSGAFSGAGRQAGGKYDAVMQMMSDEGFQRRLQRTAGITGTVNGRPGGQLADPLSTLQTMQASGSLVTGEQFARLAGSSEAGQTLQTLIQGMRNPENGAIQDALNANEAQGAEYVNGTMRDFGGVAGFGNQANQMANFVENGQNFATYADNMADSVDTLNSKFPLAVEGLDNLSGGLEKLIALMGGVGLMGGATAAAGGGAALAGGAGGAGVVGTTLATVGGGSAALGGLVAGGVVGGAVMGGMLVNKGIHNAEQDEQFAAMGGEAGRAERAVAAGLARRAQSTVGTADAVPWLPTGGTGRGGGVPTVPTPPPAPHAAAVAPSPNAGFLGAAGGGGSRPQTVAFDRASMDAFATTIATRMNAAQGRGPTERP